MMLLSPSEERQVNSLLLHWPSVAINTACYECGKRKPGATVHCPCFECQEVLLAEEREDRWRADWQAEEDRADYRLGWGRVGHPAWEERDW